MNKLGWHTEHDRPVRRTRQLCTRNMLTFFLNVLLFFKNLKMYI